MTGRPGRPPKGRRTYGAGSSRFSEERQRWEGWYSHGSGRNRVRKMVTGKSAPEVQEKLRALAERARTNDLDAPDTVAQLAERWCKHFPQRAVQTHDRIAQHIIADPNIGSAKLHNLGIDRVEHWLAEKNAGRDGGYSHRYLTLMRNDLGTMIRWAIDRRYMTHNPARGATIPAVESTATKRTLTPEQSNALIEACQTTGRSNARFLLVMLLTGCRPGEIAGLPSDNVDTDAGVLHIRQAIKRGRGGQAVGVGDVKGKRCRSFEIDPRVLDAIRQERAHQATMRLAAGPNWSTDWKGLIFLSATGNPPWASNVRKSLSLLIEDAGIGSHWTPYELRHTLATLMCEQGLPIGEVADQLGHADERMIWKNYRHRTDPVVRQRATIARIFKAN